MKNILLRSSLALGLVALGSTAILAQSGHNRPGFSELDSNGDGVITLEEVQNQAQAQFAEADTNGDGLLDADELAAAAARERAAKIARMISRKDQNGDGLLSLEEMAPRGGKGARLFARADTDGNGEISQAEWEAAQANGRPHAAQTPPASN